MNMSLLSNSRPSQDSPYQRVTFPLPDANIRFIRETEQSSGGPTWYQQRHYKAFKADFQKAAEIAQDLEGSRNLIYARK
jgi:hypothetical protein